MKLVKKNICKLSVLVVSTGLSLPVLADIYEPGIKLCQENPSACNIPDPNQAREEGIKQGKQECQTNPDSCGIIVGDTAQAKEEGVKQGKQECQTSPASCGIVVGDTAQAKEEGVKQGKQECQTSPASCGIVVGDTTQAKEEGVKQGKQECQTSPASCGIVVGDTAQAKEEGVKQGKQDCQTNPASCGIVVGDTAQAKEEGVKQGKQECQTNPASCGIVVGDTNQAKEEGVKQGKQECQASPASCGIVVGDTNRAKEDGIKQGRQECQASPASCGIVVGDTTQAKEEGVKQGKQECQTNPASCGIVVGDIAQAKEEGVKQGKQECQTNPTSCQITAIDDTLAAADKKLCQDNPTACAIPFKDGIDETFKTACGGQPLANGSDTFYDSNSGLLQIPAVTTTDHTVYQVNLCQFALPSRPGEFVFWVNLDNITELKPPFVTVPPQISKVTSTGFELRVPQDNQATVYYLVMTKGGPVPTSEDVKAGTGPAGTAAVKSGHTTIDASHVDKIEKVDGLTADTEYEVYVVTEDMATPPHLQKTVSKLSIKTEGAQSQPLSPTVTDTKAPTFETGFPKVATITTTGFELVVQTNEPATVYYVMVTKDEPAPSPEEVKAGSGNQGKSAIKSGHLQIDTPKTDKVEKIEGLTVGNEYEVYVVAEDSAANLQTATTKLTVPTAASQPSTSDTSDTVAPTFETEFPKVAEITATGFELVVQTDEPATVYYVMVTKDEPAPSPEEVKAGSGNQGKSAIKSGHFQIDTPKTDKVEKIEGLMAGNEYEVYVVAEDSAANLQTATTKLTVPTAASQPSTSDTVAPTFETDFPKVAKITATGFELVVQANEKATVYYVVVAKGEPAPTSTEVKAGTGTQGKQVVKNGNFLIDTPKTDAVKKVEGLTTGNYEVYVVAEDMATPPNQQQTPTPVTVTLK